jgi:hypothetical protein
MRFILAIEFLAVAFIFSGCATRTKYQPNDNAGGGGYSDNRVDEKIVASRFAGNAYTNKQDAALLSQFRAIEYCYEQGYRAVRFYGINDLSTSQTVQKTSSYTYQNPTYISGNAYSNTTGNMYGNNYYGNTNTNFNGTVTGGGSNSSSRTWNETYHFPTYDTYYSCTNQAFMTKVKVKEVKADDMKPFVQDLMGAVQIEAILDGSPNKEVLQVGDIVTKVNGNRVQKNPQYSSEIDASADKEHIVLTVVRDGKPTTIKAKAVDATDMILADTNKIVGAACTLSEIKSRPICTSRLPASSPQNGQSYSKPGKSADCQDPCFAKQDKHQFKSGETLESCLSESCK